MIMPVSFEIAKLLKEKGFNEVCQKWYSVEGGLYYQDEFDNNRGFIPVCECEAPTIAEVVMWLYEKHGIWIETPFWDFKFRIKIINTIEGKILRGIDFEGYNSPTEAYSAAIEYTLKHLI